MFENGRKIKNNMENPIDNIIIDFANYINKNIFYPLRFTPNMITTLSLFMGLLCPYFFYIKNYILSILFLFGAYILDCADGNYARMYNMITKFGDYYDHIADFTKFVVLFTVIIIDSSISKNIKILFFIIFGILQFMVNMHLGCQEKNYNSMDHNSLSWTKSLCVSKDDIYWTRYFGVGTIIVYIALFILFIYYNDKYSN